MSELIHCKFLFLDHDEKIERMNYHYAKSKAPKPAGLTRHQFQIKEKFLALKTNIETEWDEYQFQIEQARVANLAAKKAKRKQVAIPVNQRLEILKREIEVMSTMVDMGAFGATALRLAMIERTNEQISELSAE
jgi:hypothetical protein